MAVLERFKQTDREMDQVSSINPCTSQIHANVTESLVWRRHDMSGSDVNDPTDQYEQNGQRSLSVSTVSVLQPSWDASRNAPCLKP